MNASSFAKQRPASVSDSSRKDARADSSGEEVSLLRAVWYGNLAAAATAADLWFSSDFARSRNSFRNWEEGGERRMRTPVMLHQWGLGLREVLRSC